MIGVVLYICNTLQQEIGKKTRPITPKDAIMQPWRANTPQPGAHPRMPRQRIMKNKPAPGSNQVQ